jgi:hypothetical protein
MGPSDKSFNQVKNILSKLDRSIDALRSKRTTPPPAGALHASAEATRSMQSNTGGTLGAARPVSAFGRATPLPPKI